MSCYPSSQLAFAVRPAVGWKTLQPTRSFHVDLQTLTSCMSLGSCLTWSYARCKVARQLDLVEIWILYALEVFPGPGGIVFAALPEEEHFDVSADGVDAAQSM